MAVWLGNGGRRESGSGIVMMPKQKDNTNPVEIVQEAASLRMPSRSEARPLFRCRTRIPIFR